MSTQAVLVIDRTTGAPMGLRDAEPVKLRVCRACGRVHDTLLICSRAA